MGRGFVRSQASAMRYLWVWSCVSSRGGQYKERMKQCTIDMILIPTTGLSLWKIASNRNNETHYNSLPNFVLLLRCNSLVASCIIFCICKLVQYRLQAYI